MSTVATQSVRHAAPAVLSQLSTLPERPEVAIALVGVGQVGSALLTRLATVADCGAWRIVHARNSRAALQDVAGLHPTRIREALRAAAGGEGDASFDAWPAWPEAGARVLIDATAAPAIAERHAAWLAQGVHVVSANKLALAGQLHQWRALRDATRAGATRYGDSATVGAGLPVLATVRRLLDGGDRIRTIEGVFSGSLSFLLNRYDGSRPFSELLADAATLGYTEPDPRVDLRGTDVARKLLILARAAGHALEAHEVEVEPLLPASLLAVPEREFRARIGELDAWIASQHDAARSNGRVLRYLARLDGNGRASVRLQALLPDHPAARLDDSDNLFAIRSERYRERPLVIQGPGAGPEVTAQALLSDLQAILRARH